MTKALESEKIAHSATQVDLTKVKSSKAILAKLVSERKENKDGLGFKHEPMPESITNTLPENINPHENKEYERKKSESGSSEGMHDEKIKKEVVKELSESVGKEDVKVDDYISARNKADVHEKK
ncbi:hypothetical protein QVD17_08923 [Tagetes erecta]|uniref:Uncharacterized protein n=1 Tax=Tagetes erecta TaxID=13708 RepID=A0AAD8L3F8_TARER|nr:hypothetical protein QVD17_08923 [Tagetes erecta]